MAEFIQIHTLTSYPAGLLNRDDTGLAKRITFGGASRTRVSSQCLKRHWRSYDGEHGLRTLDGLTMSIRSKRTFPEKVARPLVVEGLHPDLAASLAVALRDAVMKKAKARVEAEDKVGAEEDVTDAKVRSSETAQVTVLGEKEMTYLLTVARELVVDDGVHVAYEAHVAALSKKTLDTLDKAVRKALDARSTDLKKNLQALGQAAVTAGLDGALFGRMVTSDVLHGRIDAAIHVAHSFTVHAETAEQDYFSAVDELKMLDVEADSGGGHIDVAELDTGLYYGYVVVDTGMLLHNLAGASKYGWNGEDRALAAEVVRRLVRTIATVSPGAKRGSTAPYAWSQFVLVEAGGAQPRTLANGFLKPMNPQPDLLANAYAALGRHVVELDTMYGNGLTRRLAAVGPVDALQGLLPSCSVGSLADVAVFAGEQVMGA